MPSIIHGVMLTCYGSCKVCPALRPWMIPHPEQDDRIGSRARFGGPRMIDSASILGHRFQQVFPRPKPLIGMIHLAPLPGYPDHPGMPVLVRKALTDLATLESAGFDGVLVENDNDRPHQIGVSASV